MNRRYALAAYVVAVHAALAVVTLRPNIANAIQSRLGISDPAPITRTQDALASRLDPAVPAGSVIFLGDSITQALPVSAISPKAINFGIGSQNTRQLSALIKRLDSLKSAERIYLNIGTNDIGPHKPGFSQDDTAALVALLPASVPLVWSGILPRAGHEAEITAANRAIASLCASRQHCAYVDPLAVMATPEGVPVPGIYIDGVHPNAKGYGLWIGAMKASAT